MNTDISAAVRELVESYTPPVLPSPDERRQIRTRAGVPLAGVARFLNVSTASVYRWERNETDPRGERRQRYADFLSTLDAVMQENGA